RSLLDSEVGFLHFINVSFKQMAHTRTSLHYTCFTLWLLLCTLTITAVAMYTYKTCVFFFMQHNLFGVGYAAAIITLNPLNIAFLLCATHAHSHLNAYFTFKSLSLAFDREFPCLPNFNHTYILMYYDLIANHLIADGRFFTDLSKLIVNDEFIPSFIEDL